MRLHRAFGAAAIMGATVLISSCAVSVSDTTTPEQARDALVSTIEGSAHLLDVQGWNRDHAPEEGDCGARRGERVDFTYGYGAPEPDRDAAADAQRVADHWRSLGMEVRVVDSPSIVVYATGGPVAGLLFSTAPGNYYIAGTSLCVPGDADEIPRQ